MARTSFIWMDVVMYTSQVASEIPTMTVKPTMQWTLEANSIECYLMECKIVHNCFIYLCVYLMQCVEGFDDDDDKKKKNEI